MGHKYLLTGSDRCIQILLIRHVQQVDDCLLKECIVSFEAPQADKIRKAAEKANADVQEARPRSSSVPLTSFARPMRTLLDLNFLHFGIKGCEQILLEKPASNRMKY